MPKPTYDVVYYWTGGSEAGQWNAASPEGDADEQVRAIRRQGYFALKGRRSIGPPDDAPEMTDPAEIAATAGGFDAKRLNRKLGIA